MLSRTLTVSIKLHYGQKSIIGYFTVHLSVTAMIDYLATTYATNKIVPFFFYLWKILFCLVPCIFLLYTVTQHHVVSILFNDSLLHIIHVQSDITETKKSLHRQIDCDELASIFICKKEKKTVIFDAAHEIIIKYLTNWSWEIWPNCLPCCTVNLIYAFLTF